MIRGLLAPQMMPLLLDLMQSIPRGFFALLLEDFLKILLANFQGALSDFVTAKMLFLDRAGIAVRVESELAWYDSAAVLPRPDVSAK